MKRRFRMVALIATVLFTGAYFTACDDDDDDDNGNGLASTLSVENIATVMDFVQSGTFQHSQATPVTTPGQSTTFKFNAGKGQALMFATMYGYSNDMFFAPENPGIELFNSDGTPITGDVSAKIKLWDNGTRINQAPGANVPRPGVAENAKVTMITDKDAQGYSYLPASDLMKVELAFDANTSEFTATITNISGGKANETPFSPGVWTVSNILDGKLVNDKPFFEKDKESSNQLTALAETGNNKPLYEMVEDMTGIITGISPVLVVVYTGDTNPIFEVGKKDPGLGLSKLAQTGDASQLKSSLERERLVRRVYVFGDKPALPGQKIEGNFEADRNDKIAIVTMFGYSNDWFYSNPTAIAGQTLGDQTSKFTLYDDGTALNQYPGAGNAQALFTGKQIAEDKVISAVDNTYPVPAVNKVIKVTIR